MFFLLLIIFLLMMIVALPIIFYKIIKIHRPQTDIIEVLIFSIFILSLILFALGILGHSAEYNVAIDPVDECYTPFGGKHVYSLLVYFVYFNLSVFALWFWGRKLAPLLLVVFLVGLFLGVIVNCLVLVQVGGHNTLSLGVNNSCFGGRLLLIMPLLALVIAVSQIVEMIRTEMDLSTTRHFKNQFLERCNLYMSQRFDVTVWAVILMLPVFIVVTLILLLFGQDVNSLVKVFTDTTTWTFSQKIHPPILDHSGHYLCTVAAKGNPKIVKPIRLGTRHGNTIIVNRQLQIANAFEELLSDYVPAIHRFIRRNYDRYGYNLSLRINSQLGSNITYVAMKPLEWIFLVCLYLFCQKPEQKIQKQYT